MTARSDLGTGAAYIAAFALALAGGWAVVALDSWAQLSGDGGNRMADALGIVMAVLAALAVFQLAFGLMTGIGRGLTYWLAAGLVVALAFGLAWLVSLTPLGKANEVEPGGYVQAFLDAMQRGMVLASVWVALIFLFGLITALLVSRRASRAAGAAL